MVRKKGRDWSELGKVHTGLHIAEREKVKEEFSFHGTINPFRVPKRKQQKSMHVIQSFRIFPNVPSI